MNVPLPIAVELYPPLPKAVFAPASNEPASSVPIVAPLAAAVVVGSVKTKKLDFEVALPVSLFERSE